MTGHGPKSFGRQAAPAARKRILLTSLSAAALLMGATMAAPAVAQAAVYQFDIPAENLGKALRDLGDASNTQLLFSPSLVAGRSSPALHGKLSSDEALKRLLAGSNLTFRRTGANVVLIEARPVTASRASALKDALPSPQPAAAAPTQADNAPVSVEEVIVTGSKRPENVQTVPASVFVATSAAMERAGVRDFDDLVRIAPSLTITKTSQPANNSINIRGIGTYAYSIATESSVAVVIDDIPQAFQATAFSALVDVRQVEVLRGPQNTLFGKSASAGVVNITTQPATDTFTGKAEAMVTNDHEKRFQATVSGPITDSLKFRLAANYSDYRGNIYNLTNGDWLNGQSDTTFRGKLVWTPAQDWAVTLSPYFTRTRASCCAGAEYFVSPGVTFSKSSLPQSLILAGITVGPDNHDTRMDVSARGDALDYGSGLKIERHLGAFTLSSISSYDHYLLKDLQDTDSTDYDFSLIAPLAPHGGSANGGLFKVNSVTQELRLTSPDDGRWRYVAGLYFSNTSSERDFVRGSNSLGTFNTLTSLPTTNSTAYSSYLSRAKATNYAVFGQATYRFTDKLVGIGGLRLNHEDIAYSFVDRGNHVSYGMPDCSTASPTVPISTCNSNTSVTGRGGLEYRFSPDIMVFAGYSRGYKGMAYDLTSTLTTRTLVASGPFKGVPVADAVAAKQPISPETVDSYEIGFKSSFFEHRLTWNVTAFNEVFEGFQAQSRDQLTGQNVLNSIGKVTSQGVETEAALVLGRNFTLNGGGAYNMAVMNSFPNANCYGAQTAAQGCVGGQQDLSGKPLFDAPRWNFSLSGEYDIPLGATGFHAFVSGGAHWQSKVVYNLLQDPDSVQGAYGLINMAAGVQNDRWKASLFVNNLLDKSYALTRGRDAQFNISQSTVPATDAITWKPARDSSRYFGVRVAVTY